MPGMKTKYRSNGGAMKSKYMSKGSTALKVKKSRMGSKAKK